MSLVFRYIRRLCSACLLVTRYDLALLLPCVAIAVLCRWVLLLIPQPIDRSHLAGSGRCPQQRGWDGGKSPIDSGRKCSMMFLLKEFENVPIYMSNRDLLRLHSETSTCHSVAVFCFSRPIIFLGRTPLGSLRR